MNKEVNYIIKKMTGTVLGIGLNEDIVSKLEENNNISNCTLLSTYNKYTKNHEKEKRSNGKSINIRKLKKKFKKKKIDYIICNYNAIEKYTNTFISDSIYINKGKLYFYGDVDIDLIKKTYNRYNTKIIIKNIKKEYLVEIDNSLAKNNLLKELYYRIIDAINHLIEIIGDILMG